MSYTVETFLSVVNAHTPADTHIGITRIKDGNATTLFYTPDDRAKLIKAIDQFSPIANVYLRITPLIEKPKHGRGTESLSAGSSVLWCDYDCYDDKLAGFSNLLTYKHQPTMIVDSGGGLQAYWQLDQFETDLEAIKARNKRLYEDLNSEQPNHYADSCYDLARVLRVPYTLNHKYDPPKQAKIVHYDPTKVYKLCDFMPAELTEVEPIEVWEPSELTQAILDSIDANDKKLYARLTKGTGAPIKDNGDIDRSRNDAYCVLRMLGLGYTPQTTMALLMAPNLTTGRKYIATKRYDYVVMTVNSALRQFKASPDQYFVKGKFQPTQLANQLQGKKHQFIYTANELWRYTNGYYQRGADTYVKALVAEKLGAKWSTHIENEVLKYLEATNHKPIEECNVESHNLINVANGMLDLTTGTLQPHDPRYLSLYQLPASYNPNADPTQVINFVESIIPKDATPFFWEFLGSVLNVRQYWPKAFMLLVGLGDSGKSTLLRFIRAILGDHNCSSVTLQALADNRFTVVKLYARLANIFADLDETEAGNVGQIKAITGDDVMYGEEKFKPGFDFKPTARLIFSANHYPTIRNADGAYFNRANIIHCPYHFDATNSDPNIDAKMSTPDNLSAALNLMYQGLLRLRANKAFTPSTSMQNEHNKYRLYADSVIGFLDTCQYQSEYETPKKDLYAAYCDMCKFGNRKVVSEQAFYRRVNDAQNRYPIGEKRPEIDNDRVWCYTGVKPPQEILTLTIRKPHQKEVTN